jgi:hypothetical protein
VKFTYLLTYKLSDDLDGLQVDRMLETQVPVNVGDLVRANDGIPYEVKQCIHSSEGTTLLLTLAFG